MNTYSANVLSWLKKRYPTHPEYLQAASEIIESLSLVIEKRPEYEKAGILERFIEPDRIITFKVVWTDDNNKVNVNTGYRVQFNSAIGPYKGGLRFHPSVNTSIVKFLGLEQVLKNSLTGQPIGGAKGGSNFDPKGKSDGEIMRFCQSFMDELWRHIGPYTDIPAGDIGVGAREIGYLYGYYKKLVNANLCSITGRGVPYGGSLVRKEATGYGLVYFVKEMLKDRGNSLCGKKVVISGSGNVAIYAHEKATSLGATVLAMSDSQGYIVDEKGIDLETVKQLKEVDRKRICEYTKDHPHAKYYEGCSNIWSVPCDIALPCATQNEIDLNSCKILVKNGVIAVGEGANMPTTNDGVKYLIDKGVMFGPAKAANAGGVATSALEMAQSSQRMYWSFDEVDAQLNNIMKNIYRHCSMAAKEYNVEGNYAIGANIAGFERVADSMLAFGIH